MPLTPHLGLLYAPPSAIDRHARHNVDLYLPAGQQPKGLMIFLHGGAWASSSSLHESLDALPSLLPQDFALAIPNYRLSNTPEKIQHPSHVEDVKAAVRWLIEERAGGLLDEATTSNVWTMGHSAGAHMLAFLLLDTPSLEPLSDSTRSKIKGYLFSECIVDVDALVDEYPDYQGWFIGAAFGPPPYLESSPANPASPFTYKATSGPQPSILISQSPTDPLISPRQPLLLKARLEGLGLKVRYEGDVLGKDGNDGGHDELLKSASFGELVSGWVQG